MQTLKFTIDSDPVPAARPRFSGRRAYQPARNRSYRELIQVVAKIAMKGRKLFSGQICAEIKLFRRFKPTAKNFGDVDNHLKAIFDGMNKIVFDDDAQVVQCVVTKHTDKLNPRAEVEIKELR